MMQSQIIWRHPRLFSSVTQHVRHFVARPILLAALPHILLYFWTHLTSGTNVTASSSVHFLIQHELISPGQVSGLKAHSGSMSKMYRKACCTPFTVQYPITGQHQKENEKEYHGEDPVSPHSSSQLSCRALRLSL